MDTLPLLVACMELLQEFYQDEDCHCGSEVDRCRMHTAEDLLKQWERALPHYWKAMRTIAGAKEHKGREIWIDAVTEFQTDLGLVEYLMNRSLELASLAN